MIQPPININLKRDSGLTIHWTTTDSTFYPIDFLRRMSPSAEARQLREEMARNPLAVLPPSKTTQTGPLCAEGAELIGNYAIRVRFSDGHSTGIYSWAYLRELADELDQQSKGTR